MRRPDTSWLLLSLALIAMPIVSADQTASGGGLGSRTLLHAHNCYPDAGHWADRLDRALSTGVSPLAIEQDVMWVPATTTTPGRSVVGHDTPPTGNEPTLEAYFFERMQPILDRALAENRRDAWPLFVLHLDFKSNEPEHHRFIREMLGRYERWLTTAPRTAAASPPQPLIRGPLLVLTENGENQERVFYDEVPIGGRLRIFGTVAPSPVDLPKGEAARAAAQARLPVDSLVPSGATNYRRWTNHAWTVVEEGGPPKAGEWTAADQARLLAIVTRAHELGLWIRFYTLDGYEAAESRGWTDSYNFGSRLAAETRWRAAIAARVDLLATDQYEAIAPLLR
jgi:hypothetical protein